MPIQIHQVYKPEFTLDQMLYLHRFMKRELKNLEFRLLPEEMLYREQLIELLNPGNPEYSVIKET